MNKNIIVLAITVVAYTSMSHGQMDSSSRNLLIQKLERANLNLANNDPSKVAVSLRLADLYSEKARLESMKELESGCTVCKAGEADQKKALRYYTDVLDRAPEATKGKVLVQVGHLYQLLGQEQKSIEFYKKIIKTVDQQNIRAEASVSLGEIYYKHRDYSAAKAFYSDVLKNSAASSRGLAAYRLAWCYLNLSDINSAIEQLKEILNSPTLLARSNLNQGQIDSQFYDEVAKDYATFLAKRKINQQDVESLFNLSPETSRIQNVQQLAFEAERIGKKPESLMVWKFIVNHLQKPEEKLSAKVAMAQLYFDEGDKKSALSSFESAMALWPQVGVCTNKQCEEVRRRSRQFVVSWNQVEKKAPTRELHEAYQQYLTIFKDDIDINIYAAKVAKDLKEGSAGATDLAQARKLILASIPVDQEKLESVLVSFIELAEDLKDQTMMQEAYDTYLQSSVKKTKLSEVLYQKAHHLYELADYKQAADEFKKLALTKNIALKIRKQAADLSLDSLVLLKGDGSRIESWSTEYATVFPESADEYSKITQKSVLTRAANLASQNSEAAYSELVKMNVDKASPEDRVKFFKNKIILAEKLQKYSEALSATTDLISQPTVSLADREFALQRRAYLSELILDFVSALTAIEKLQSIKPTDENLLKMAIFAGLSGKPTLGYQEKYLKTSKNEENKLNVIIELIHQSKNPEKELVTYRKTLEKSPAVLADLYLELYNKNPKPEIIKQIAKDEKLQETDSGQLLLRVAYLNDFAILQKKIADHRLDTKSDKKMAFSLKTRVGLLDQLDLATQRAIKSGDWACQLVSINSLANQSDRFYNEVVSAPVPQNLTEDDQQQYLKLLTAQAAPFLTKANEAKSKVKQFWDNQSWNLSLRKSWEQKEKRNLILKEISSLQEIVPPEQANLLSGFNNEESGVALKTNPQEVLKIRQRIAQDPLNRQALQELLKLEKSADNSAMVQYLTTRIETLNGSVQ